MADSEALRRRKNSTRFLVEEYEKMKGMPEANAAMRGYDVKMSLQDFIKERLASGRSVHDKTSGDIIQ